MSNVGHLFHPISEVEIALIFACLSSHGTFTSTSTYRSWCSIVAQV